VASGVGRGPGKHVGLGSPGFAPSVASANAALGGMVKKDRHPSGTAGTSYSLEKMAAYIREGRNDPRMRAWAGKVLLAAGKPATVTGQTQALLDEIRRKTVAMQDPVNTELMAKPSVLLCFDKSLCMPVGDCFPKGTLVLRDDMEFVPIENIRVGDRIWGRDAWTTVTAHWYKGILNVSAVKMNNGSAALLTPDHHVFVLRCDRHANRKPETPDCACPDEDLRMERVRVSELREKDRLIQPKRIAFGTEGMDPDRAWIEGLFVSDGWTRHNTSFEISGQDGCPKEENKRRIQELCEKWRISTRWNRKYISVQDKEWTLRMQQMGHRAPNKHALSINLEEGAAGALLRGIMADSGQNTNGPGRTFTTTSKQLFLQTRVLHRMFGVGCGSTYITEHGGLGENPIFRLFVRVPKEGGRVEKKLRVKSVEHGVVEAPCYDISTSDHYVYLPEDDVTVSNCDDRCIALGSATLSVGIETMAVAQAYGTPQATHVILAVLDPDTGWQRVDPLSDTMPVGKYYPATKEWWMDPITGNVSNDGSSAPHTLGKEPAHGDFVGVGKAPAESAPHPHQMFPEPTGLGRRPEAGMGVFPFNHPFGAIDEGPEQGAAYAPAEMHTGLFFPDQPVRPTPNKCCGPEPIFPFITSNSGGLLAPPSPLGQGMAFPGQGLSGAPQGVGDPTGASGAPQGVGDAPTGVGLTLVETKGPQKVTPPIGAVPANLRVQGGVGAGPAASRSTMPGASGGVQLPNNTIYWDPRGFYWSRGQVSGAPRGQNGGTWRPQPGGFVAWYPPYEQNCVNGFFVVIPGNPSRITTPTPTGFGPGATPGQGLVQILDGYWAQYLGVDKCYLLNSLVPSGVVGTAK